MWLTISVSHMHSEIHSMAPATTLHKILHPTPKGEPQAGLLPSCSSNSTNSMEQDFGNLGSTLGQMKMSQEDWRSTRPPRAHRPGHTAGWETHFLVLWSCIFQWGSGRLERLNQRLRDHSGSSWNWRWFRLLIPLLKKGKNIYPGFQELRVSSSFHHFALKLKSWEELIYIW